jgi:hypothetical protein
MNFKSLLIVGLASLTLYGCSDKPLTAEEIKSLALAKNVVVIQDPSADASLAAVNMAAYDASGTDYSKTTADMWVDAGEWQEPLNMADMLVCIMGASSHPTLANATYQALVDMTICNNDTGDQTAAIANYADVVMTVSRASNTSNQIGTGYFTQTEDDNGDGDTTDAGEKSEFVAEILVTEASTTTNPYGVVTMNWNLDNAPTGNYSRGSLAFTNASTTDVGISFLEQNKNQNEGYEYDQWAAGTLKKDGSGGSIKVSKVDGTEKIFKVAFNGTHALIQKDAEAQSCVDLSSMTTIIHSYNLFDNTSGALKDITAGLQFVHGADKDKRGYAGSYKDGNGATKNWMWVQDGSAPTIIYKESDTTTAYNVTWSAGRPTIAGLTFDAPIRFEASFEGVTPAGVSDTRTDKLNYEGPGQLYGINWTISGDTNTDGECQPNEYDCEWSPDYNLTNGLLLTATDATTWRVKRTSGKKVPSVVATSNCSALSLVTSAAFTKPTLSAVTHTFTTKPVVTGKPKVIQGVLQY